MKHRLKLRDPAAIKLNRLLSQPERLLVTVLIVTNLMNICALTLATQEFVRDLGNWGYVVAGVISCRFISSASSSFPNPSFVAFLIAPSPPWPSPCTLKTCLLAPLHFVGRTLARLVSRRRPAENRKLFVAREEFKYLTIESERTGTLTRTERQLIHNVVDFRAVTATDVMVPMAKVHSISAETSVDELLARVKRRKSAAGR